MLLVDDNMLIDREGFKYIKLERVFREETNEELTLRFPDLNEMIKRRGYKNLKFSNGNRFDIDMGYISKYDILGDIWSDLVREVTGLEYFKRLCRLFGLDDDLYNSISYRNEDTNTDVKVDFQICYNTKNKGKDSGYLREPHVDAKDKLIVMLFYFPYMDEEYTEEDEGQLCLYDKNNRVIDEIKYMRNWGIVFKNDQNAIHAPKKLRNHGDEHRRFINVVFIDNKQQI